MGDGLRDVMEKGQGKRQGVSGRLEMCILSMLFSCALEAALPG